MSKLGAVKFAYVVIAVTRKHDPALDVTHAPAAPQIGDVIVFPDDQGTVYIREEDHEVGIVDIIHLYKIAVGREVDGEIDFDYEAKRVLALVQIGANAERVLHQEIDRVFSAVEAGIGLGDLAIGKPWMEKLEQLRKEFT